VALAKEAEGKIVNDLSETRQRHGFTPVQIALLSQRINELTEHFKTHKKGQSFAAWPAQDGLTSPKLLDYLKKTNIQQYHEVVGRWVCAIIGIEEQNRETLRSLR
jgi:small subunit ribosomal protein S15